MQGSVKERIRNNARDKQGKIRQKIKVYDVYYRYTDIATGRLKNTVKRGFLTKKEAEVFLLEINEQQQKGIFCQPQVILVKTFLDDWLNTYVKINVRKSTYYGYKRIIEHHLIPHLGGFELKKLTAVDIDRLYAYLLQKGRVDGKGGLTAKSVQYTHRVLNEALEHAVKKKLIYYNPVKGITTIPKPKPFNGNIYTADEILKLLTIVKDSMYEVPVALAAICGLRRGECLGLKEKDISFEEKTINIVRQLADVNNKTIISEPKSTNGIRLISAPDEVFAILEQHIKKNHYYKQLLGKEYDDQGWIVCRNDGKWIRPILFSKNFANLIKRNRLKKIRFHDLRHSCASLMLNSGVPMKIVSQILGHSSIGITADLYTHVLQENKKDAAKNVGDMLFGRDKE
ncbi:tyrosine-type recombinase/integrase [Pectinatus frisingensis]|uniref:tyrosine-type recombinase/integrase n=1 Tax=Pectinatus frisingensis TaxID=865 RepID=UPI0018C71082|nr:tyrosine-type recombinase/integrase [Pectinatus frisingensis]